MYAGRSCSFKMPICKKSDCKVTNNGLSSDHFAIRTDISLLLNEYSIEILGQLSTELDKRALLFENSKAYNENFTELLNESEEDMNQYDT